MFKKIKKIIQKNLKRGLNGECDIKEEELLEYIKKGAKIIDVRSPQEFEEGHVDGAINIPDYEIRKNAENFLKNKDEIIVLYCSTGQRSKKVQEQLIKMGYKYVYNLCNM